MSPTISRLVKSAILALLAPGCVAESTPDAEGQPGALPPASLLHKGILTVGGEDHEIEYEVRDGHAIFEGDIVLGAVDDKADNLKPTATGRSDYSRRFNVGPLWPNSTILIQIPAPTNSAQIAAHSRLTAAMDHVSSRTGIEFSEVPAGYIGDFVQVSYANSCESAAGRLYGMQPLTIGGCLATGNVIHELGHTTGLWHEHQRSDRAGYIQIAAGGGSNCEIKSASVPLLGRYDYESIMHYASGTLECGTIRGADGGIITLPGGGTIGQRTGLSPGDIRGIQIMYGNEYDPPVAVASSGANLHAFVQGSDGRLYASLNYGGFGLLGPTTGTIDGSPEPVVRSGGRVDLLIRGSDDALYLKGWTGSGWWPSGTGFQRIGGVMQGHPATVAPGGERIDVFSRSSAGTVQHKYFDGGWFPAGESWEDLGLSVAGPITATAGGSGSIHLLAASSDHQVWYRFYGAGTWFPWLSIGGLTPGRISAITKPDGTLEVVVRGYDGSFHRKQRDPFGNWAPAGAAWQLIGTNMNGAATMTVRSGGVVEVLGQSFLDGTMRLATLPASTGSSAPTWSNLGGGLVGSPNATSLSDGRIDAFVRGGDDAVYYRVRTTSAGAWAAFVRIPSVVSW